MKFIETIEELKQRIGKFIVTSEYDEECRGKYSSMKLLTKIENSWIRQHPMFLKNETELYGLELYGKYAATLDPFIPLITSYTNVIRYARDPTQEELKKFKNCWRKLIYQKYYTQPFHPLGLIP